MELSLLEILPNVGVGIAAIIVLYLSYRMFVKAMRDREQAFQAYIKENNHRVTDLVKEATSAIKESSEAIKESTTAIHNSTESIKDIRNYLFSNKK